MHNNSIVTIKSMNALSFIKITIIFAKY